MKETIRIQNPEDFVEEVKTWMAKDEPEEIFPFTCSIVEVGDEEHCDFSDDEMYAMIDKEEAGEEIGVTTNQIEYNFTILAMKECSDHFGCWCTLCLIEGDFDEPDINRAIGAVIVSSENLNRRVWVLMDLMSSYIRNK